MRAAGKKETLSGIKRYNTLKCINAIRVLTREIERGRALPEFFYLRGRAYLLLSMNYKASADFEKASVLRPQSIRYKKMLAASLLLSEDYHKCLDSLRDCPETRYFNLIKGVCLYKSGKAGEAIRVLDGYCREAPYDHAGHHQRARCLMALDRPGEAGYAFRRSLLLGGDPVDNMTWLGLSLMAFERKEKEAGEEMPLAA
jgi:tetratricopeptide (TPR) repeat protein